MTTSKKYNQFSAHLKEKFGQKVYKITLDAGFSCPNRENSSGEIVLPCSSGSRQPTPATPAAGAGCIFCDESGSFSQAHSNLLSIEDQIAAGAASLGEKFNAKSFMAYFQAFSNTYKPAGELDKIYRSALTREDVVGISIGTRPDCVDEEKLDVIAGLDTYTWVEYGLQSANDKTLQWMNRGHDFACFERAVELTKARGIKVCAHVILGLPETHEEVMHTAKELARLNVDGVKIHMLCALEGTALGENYRNVECRIENVECSNACGVNNSKFYTLHSTFTEDDYVKQVCDFLEHLPASTTIHRLAASGLKKSLIAPLWVNNKFSTLNKIDREFERRGSAQGMRGRDVTIY